mgnify:CR=1 FL=1
MTATYTISSQSSPVFKQLISNLNNPNEDNSSNDEKNMPIKLKNIKVMRCKNNDPDPTKETLYDTYKLVNYSHHLTQSMTGTVGVLKSLLFTDDNRLISFSPPKSHSYEGFADMFVDITKLQVEEFIDGTMVSLFWDDRLNDWEIMTRKKVGANNFYYTYTPNDKQPTFRSMFYDAVSASKLNIDTLDKKYVYSFVLRHTNNRIITKVNSCELYLIEVYSIENDILQEELSYAVTIVSRNDVMEMPAFKESSVKTPKQLAFTNYNEMISSVDDYNKDPSIPKGYIIRDVTTGSRTKIQCKTYTDIMDNLKCNYSDTRYMYLNLRSKKLVSKYLEFFPEHTSLFNYYHNLLCDYTHFLFAMYIECYMKKTKPLNTYPSHVKTHMFSLHKIYNERNKEKSISMKDVMTYVNNMDVPLLYSTLFTYSK